MTDAVFYTAYDDMPSVTLRLRRPRRSGRGYGRLASLWLMAAGATALSALPALAPGVLNLPRIAARTLPAMRAAQEIIVPRHPFPEPLLRPEYVAGPPAFFANAHPLGSRLVRTDAPVLTAATEAAAPTPAGARAVAYAEPAAPGPVVLAAADAQAEDAASIVPQLPAATSPLIAADVPLPTPRPADLAPTVSHDAPFRATRRPAVLASTAPAGAPAVSPDNRSFLEKFFSFGAQPSAPATAALGYAAPETGFFSSLRGVAANPANSYGGATAVYEIASHTVFMPDGSRLEAHSGLGERLDDPRFVHERMRGPTPPATYDLALRESLFHGVQALRLNPVGNSVFGRTGLLAHTFMLGPKGDSNGCVSFRNYRAFLQAFQNGGVRCLVVVGRLS